MRQSIIVRQHYFTEGEFLKYEKNYTLLKNSPNDKALNSNQHNSHIGKQNNQNFVHIPYGQFTSDYCCFTCRSLHNHKVGRGDNI